MEKIYIIIQVETWKSNVENAEKRWRKGGTEYYVSNAQTKETKKYRLNIEKATELYLMKLRTMTKERILLMIEKLLKIYEAMIEEEDLDYQDNNLVELVWEDEDGNGIYKIKG